jgi:DNA-directed RNA polymerase
LASALLNFAEGLTLTDSGRDYLYIYGANNHNHKNISKENFKKRIA